MDNCKGLLYIKSHVHVVNHSSPQYKNFTGCKKNFQFSFPSLICSQPWEVNTLVTEYMYSVYDFWNIIVVN